MQFHIELVEKTIAFLKKYWREFLFTLNTEKSGVGNELVLFYCSKDCQNDVILYRVEIPLFFTGQLLLKIWC